MTQVFAVVTKSPEEVVDFQISWDSLLEDSETINTSTWTVPSGITKDSDSKADSDTDTQIVLSGGTLNETYDLTNKVTTTGGSTTRTFTRVLRVAVQYKSNVDRVRLLVGDQDTSDELAADDEYVWALGEAGDNKYGAAAIICRAIAGKFARRVDTSFGGLRANYSQRREAYLALAARYERDALLKGGGIGEPIAGGVSIAEIDAVEDDSDRPKPAFRRDQFRNPPDTADADDWWDYHN